MGLVLAVAFDGAVATDFGDVASINAGMIWGGGYNAYGDVVIAAGAYDGLSAIYRIAPVR